MTELSRREFTKARHAQRRVLMKACREVTKGTAWRSNKGVLFCGRGEWLVAIQEMTDVLNERTRARLTVKPMSIDPIFWNIIGHPELCEQPLSFRYFGWMKCGFLTLEEPEVSEIGGVTEIAKRMLDLGERKLTEVCEHWTQEDFLSRLGEPTKPDQKFVTWVATLLAYGRLDRAEALCADSAARGLSGGFLSSARGSFNQMVVNWIRQQRTVENTAISG